MTIQARKKIEADKFIKNISPVHAYILGFLWADGYIQKNKRKYDYNIKINITIEDAKEIYSLLLKTGNWRYTESSNKNNKKYARLRYANKYLHEFLCKNDYLIKSSTQPTKILNHLNQDLHHYWWRGYLDGDGYCNLDPKTGQHVIYIASNFDQNWDFCKNLCEELEVEFHLKSHKTTIHANSHFYLVGKQNVYKFLHFIYKNYNNIGLNRKFNKFKNAIEFFKNQELTGIGLEKYKTNFYLREVGSFKNLEQAINARRKFIWNKKRHQWNKYFPHLGTYSKFLRSCTLQPYGM